MGSAGLISVVIPAYNAEATLPETLASAVAQRGVDFEVVVVDDGSQDGTADVVSSLGAPVRLVRQANAGVGAARNKALTAVRGEWVAFLDADDLWAPDKLQRQLEALRRSGSAGLCYTGVRLVDGAGQEYTSAERWARPGPRPEGWAFRSLLLQDNPICNSSVLVSRHLLSRVGPFSCDAAMSEDYDMWLRVAWLAPLRYLTEPLTSYRVLTDSYYRADPRRARLRALAAVDAAVARVGLDRPKDRRALRRRRADILFGLAYELERRGERVEAARWYLRALRQWPADPRVALQLAALGAPRRVRCAARPHLGLLRRWLGRG